MKTHIPIDTLRKNLSGTFLDEMITPVIITVNGVETKVIMDLPRTKSQLALVQSELEELYDSFKARREHSK